MFKKTFFALAALLSALVVLGFVAPQASAATATCPLTQGYWKNHSDAWKLSTLTLGTRSYTKAAALNILGTPVAGDASLILADQLIAALLNIANGSNPSSVSATIADANTLLDGGLIPESIAPSSPVGQQMVKDAAVLDKYNSGRGGSADCGTPPPPIGSCQPSSSLTVLNPPATKDVVAYVPKGNWGSAATGVSVVNVEGSSITPTLIPTTAAVNSCASNSLTGQTVCTANNNQVYLLAGTGLTSTLTSSGAGIITFSGGACTNCGVAMDATHNRAVIGLSVAGAPGFQVLNLGATPAFETAFVSPAGLISEDILIDPVRNLILSASENNNYELVDIATSTSPTFAENAGIASGGVLDSSGEDCSTGIALAPAEFSSPSHVFLADLKQATVTPGSPGTWSAPSQVQVLSESFLSAGASGIAVAQGTHTGTLTGEFGGDALTAIALPTTSGSGVPAISDWVTCSISGFSNGFDPHTVTAYQSPNNGHAIALLANAGATSLAVVDLSQMLNATTVPRTAGGHACASGTLPAGVVSFISVP